MRRLHLLVLLLAVPPQAELSGQGMSLVGRWVNIDPTDFQLFVLVFEPDGRVHRLMPAPQFSATYRVEGEHLVIDFGDGSRQSYVVRGDTLASDGPGAFIRLTDTPHDTGSVGGTWRFVPGGSMERFMTLRSDGQVVLEVGFPVQATVSGDTLRLISSQLPTLTFQLPTLTFRLYQQGDTLLHLQDAAGKNRLLLRRPWGCFGIEALDARAAECQAKVGN